tara:strand:- start:5625 stop:6002 length:378 start_codon:yes stop_codon:yes gene_type:complete
MDYTGESFISQWKNNHLKIKALKVDSLNSLGLLKIVLDAAISSGPFKLSWDLREMERPSIMQWFEILSFVNQNCTALNKNTIKLGMLVSPRMQRLVTYALKMSPPSCSYAVSSEWKEIKFFMRDD